MPWIYANDTLDEYYLDALRPPCPTCDGKGVVVTPDAVGKAFFAVLDKGKGAGVPHLTCPDCTDGRMPWERMAAIVTAAFVDNGWSTPTVEYLRSVRP